MVEVHPNLLWIGHTFDIRKPRTLFNIGITAIIDVAYEEPVAAIPRQFTYCRFPINDGGGNEPQILLQILLTATDFLRFNTRTAITCSAGRSRSPTIAAFALAYHLNLDPGDLIAKISKTRSLELKQKLWVDMRKAFDRMKTHRDTRI